MPYSRTLSSLQEFVESGKLKKGISTYWGLDAAKLLMSRKRILGSNSIQIFSFSNSFTKSFNLIDK